MTSQITLKKVYKKIIKMRRMFAEHIEKHLESRTRKLK